jgi:hypothetical protein
MGLNEALKGERGELEWQDHSTSLPTGYQLPIGSVRKSGEGGERKVVNPTTENVDINI